MIKPKFHFPVLFISFALFSACKSTVPIGKQIAPPVEAGFIKGPAMVSYGKFYFMEEQAFYKPYKWYFINFQKATVFPYAEIDTVENSKLYGILPVVANLKLKTGKTHKIRINKKKNLDKTLNALKK